jgi:hypothetical protein
VVITSVEPNDTAVCLLATVSALDIADVLLAHQIDLGINLEGLGATIANHHVADARKLHLDSLRAGLLATVSALDIADVLIAHQIDLGTNLKGLPPPGMGSCFRQLR